MDKKAFLHRTKRLAVRIIRITAALPRNEAGRVLGRQIIRSGTSIGANYRAACRARSKAEMIAKLGIVEEEADETIYWLELMVEADLIAESKIAALKQETDEILAMTIASIRTLKGRR